VGGGSRQKEEMATRVALKLYSSRGKKRVQRIILEGGKENEAMGNGSGKVVASVPPAGSGVGWEKKGWESIVAM